MARSTAPVPARPTPLDCSASPTGSTSSQPPKCRSSADRAPCTRYAQRSGRATSLASRPAAANPLPQSPHPDAGRVRAWRGSDLTRFGTTGKSLNAQNVTIVTEDARSIPARPWKTGSLPVEGESPGRGASSVSSRPRCGCSRSARSRRNHRLSRPDAGLDVAEKILPPVTNQRQQRIKVARVRGSFPVGARLPTRHTDRPVRVSAAARFAARHGAVTRRFPQRFYVDLYDAIREPGRVHPRPNCRVLPRGRIDAPVDIKEVARRAPANATTSCSWCSRTRP